MVGPCVECTPPGGIMVEAEMDTASGRVRWKDERELRGGSNKAGPAISERRERGKERQLRWAAKLTDHAR